MIRRLGGVVGTLKINGDISRNTSLKAFQETFENMCDCMCLDHGKDSDGENDGNISTDAEKLWRWNRYSSMTEVKMFQRLESS
ncbi:hypothetical protein TNCV_708221 [Trichonephila clavipes]|nr:hypothetical protein TNCV_708221 [Trichonephila clavipes]